MQWLLWIERMWFIGISSLPIFWWPKTSESSWLILVSRAKLTPIHRIPWCWLTLAHLTIKHLRFTISWATRTMWISGHSASCFSRWLLAIFPSKPWAKKSFLGKSRLVHTHFRKEYQFLQRAKTWSHDWSKMTLSAEWTISNSESIRLYNLSRMLTNFTLKSSSFRYVRNRKT